MRYIISVIFMDGSEITTASFDNGEDADDHIRRVLIQLLGEGYKEIGVTEDGIIYSKGFWFWKKEVLIKYETTILYKEGEYEHEL